VLKLGSSTVVRGRVELHVHLDGATSFDTLWDIVQSRNLSVPAGINSASALEQSCSDFGKSGFGWFVCVLDILGGDAWSITLAAERFVAFQHSRNVTYTEVRYAPQTLAVSQKYGVHLSPAATVAAVTAGLRKGMDAHPGTTIFQILCASRHLPTSSCFEVAALTRELSQGSGTGRVVGMDLAGNETAYPNPPFIPCFRHAHAIGLNTTIHAGEPASSTAESVYEAVVDMQADRIGHGYAAIDNATVVALLRRLNVHLEACPSTCLEEYTGTPGGCPISHFRSAGIDNFGINTDDPTLWNSSLPIEEWKAKKYLGLTMQEIEMAYKNAYAARFGS